ncbi:unnamed protein product [Pleuronectes platessa]|uniref:Uncharacterized protein n=1 Tax=Pleuronectes platessa TaxID=8262 RepID=A0A9N7Y6T6_PLEPL|nr:unnamed protein product [Pleuronectes platessa]
MEEAGGGGATEESRHLIHVCPCQHFELFSGALLLATKSPSLSRQNEGKSQIGGVMVERERGGSGGGGDRVTAADVWQGASQETPHSSSSCSSSSTLAALIA